MSFSRLLVYRVSSSVSLFARSYTNENHLDERRQSCLCLKSEVCPNQILSVAHQWAITQHTLS